MSNIGYQPTPEAENMQTGYSYDDGGRKECGYKNSDGDCMLRAYVICENANYREARKLFLSLGWRSYSAYINTKTGKPYKNFYREQERNIWKNLGYDWVVWDHKTQGRWGRPDDAPSNVVVSIRKHLVAKIDGKFRDTFDSRFTRYFDDNTGQALKGARAVYGWYVKQTTR